MKLYEFVVDPKFVTCRLDRFLYGHMVSYSRAYLQKLINSQKVTVCGLESKPGFRLKGGEIIKLEMPDPIEMSVQSEQILLDIIFEDDQMLVINKAQGMVVHPAAGNRDGTLVNALLYHCKGNLSSINGMYRPGILHRIDKNTSGLILVAKTDFAHFHLSKQVREHSVARLYKAIVHGKITVDSGTIIAKIGRHRLMRKKMCINGTNAREAITHYRVLDRFERYSVVECKLQTGRTHQIRVHLSSIGHPIVGDRVYCNRTRSEFNLQGQLLHAYKIGFVHPKSQKYMEFIAPPPEYFQKVYQKLSEIVS